jgi:hypothetical protein
MKKLAAVKMRFNYDKSSITSHEGSRAAAFLLGQVLQIEKGSRASERTSKQTSERVERPLFETPFVLYRSKIF